MDSIVRFAPLGGAAIITSLSGQTPKMRARRQVGALIAVEQADPEAQERAKTFAQGLQEQGFREGDIEIDWRWAVRPPTNLLLPIPTCWLFPPPR